MIILHKNLLFHIFKDDFLYLIKTYHDKEVIDNNLNKEINILLDDLTNKINKEYEKYISSINKINERLEQSKASYSKLTEEIKNKYLYQISNIEKNTIKVINSINEDIAILQGNYKNNVSDIKKNIDIKTKKVLANTSLIKEAYKLNIERLKNSVLESKKIYSENIDFKVNRSKKNINNVHSSISRKIVMSNENDNQTILKLQEEIEELQVKLNEFYDTHQNNISEITQKKLLDITKTNAEINTLTTEKNLRIKSEKESNLIKQNDISKQLAFFEEDYNTKVQKILGNFVFELKEYDDNLEEFSKIHKKELEKTKRNYLYTYYQLIHELNNYLKESNNLSHDSFKIKSVNKKLHKLKINSYYEKLADAKEKFEAKTEALNQSYAQNLKLYEYNKKIAEINKDYALEVARVEFQGIKDNNKLLGNYIASQIAINEANINNEYTYSLAKIQNNSNLKIAEYDKEINLLRVNNQYSTNEIKINIANLKAKENKITNTISLREDYLNKTSFIQRRLEQIVTNLELDRNAKILDYNNLVYKYKENSINLHKDLEENIIKLKYDYYIDLLNLKLNEQNLNFSLNRLNYVRKIDEARIKEKYHSTFQKSYTIKNNSLLELNQNCRMFRLCSVNLVQNGLYLFYTLENTLDFYIKLSNLFKDRLESEDYEDLFKYISEFFFNNINKMLSDFTKEEIMLIDEIIQNETKDTYNSRKTLLNLELKDNISNLEKYIKNLEEIIGKYKSTINQFTTKKNEIKELKNNYTSSIKNLFDKEYINIYLDYFNFKRKINSINHKININKKLIKQTNKKIENTKIKHYKVIDKLNIEKHDEYEYSYNLINSANKLLSHMTNLLSNLKTKYITNYNIDQDNKKLFTELALFMENCRNKYINMFNLYNDGNKKQYEAKKNSIVNLYKSDLRKDYKEQLKSLKSVKKTYTKTLNNVLLELNKVKDDSADLDNKYTANKLNLINKYNKKFKANEADFKIYKEVFYKEVYSITDNISYSRNNYLNITNKYLKDFKNDITNINDNYKDEVANNEENLASYKDRLNNDIETIPLNYNKTLILEKANLKEEKNTYNKNKSLNTVKKKLIKKSYNKNRISNISNSTNLLLNKKVELDKNLKKVKLSTQKNKGSD